MSVRGKTLGQLFEAAGAFIRKAASWIWTKALPGVWKLAQWGALGYALWWAIDWLSNFEAGPGGPSQGDAVIAWGAKGFAASLIGILIPLFVIGAARRSPIQEWLLPDADELRDGAKAIRAKLNRGEPLSDAEA